MGLPKSNNNGFRGGPINLGQINTSSLAVMVHCSKRLVWQPFEHVTCHLTNVSLLSVLANLHMS